MTSDTTPANTPDTEDEVHIHSIIGADGVPAACVTITPDSDKRCKVIYVDHRDPIPVIFIPGVMGSVLCDKDSGHDTWNPPNTDNMVTAIPGILGVLAGYFDSAAKRAKTLDPLQSVVDPHGPMVSIDEAALGFNEKEARRRGWSTVYRTSYQHMLVWLQQALDNPMRMGKPIGEWIKGDTKGKEAALNAILGTAPSHYGAHGPNAEPLTADSPAFKALCNYRYPVYAIGYNFLQSNEISGQQSLDGVDFFDPDTKKPDGRIMGIREICRENKTDKAIIITHSMGGLVARMASQFSSGAESMLGVIHGAQPATGAPLFAKRYRTGAEGNNFGERLTNKSMMGRNDAEFVAIASNAEGPTELSPMPDYHDFKPWWIIADKNSKPLLSLPQHDALSELYTTEAWYGLLPDKSILDPAGIVKKAIEAE